MVSLSWQRIWALMQRHLLLQFRDAYRVLNIVFWPIFDVVIWGYLSVWTRQNSDGVLFIPVIGAFFWQVVARSGVDIATSLLDELQSKNLTNIFSSPLTFLECISALSLVSAIRMIAILGICGLSIWLLQGYSMFMFGWWLLLLIPLLLFMGWFLGLLASAILFIWGMRGADFIWALGWCFSAFCGVFYPISVLSPMMQNIASWLPMTYIFQAIHGYVATGVMNICALLIGFSITVAYGIGAIVIIRYVFKRAQNRGLARLEVD